MFCIRIITFAFGLIIVVDTLENTVTKKCFLFVVFVVLLVLGNVEVIPVTMKYRKISVAIYDNISLTVQFYARKPLLTVTTRDYSFYPSVWGVSIVLIITRHGVS